MGVYSGWSYAPPTSIILSATPYVPNSAFESHLSIRNRTEMLSASSYALFWWLRMLPEDLSLLTMNVMMHSPGCSLGWLQTFGMLKTGTLHSGAALRPLFHSMSRFACRNTGCAGCTQGVPTPRGAPLVTYTQVGSKVPNPECWHGFVQHIDDQFRVQNIEDNQIPSTKTRGHAQQTCTTKAGGRNPPATSNACQFAHVLL